MIETVSSMDLFIDRMEFEIESYRGNNPFELYETLKKYAVEYKSDFREYEVMIQMITERLGI